MAKASLIDKPLRLAAAKLMTLVIVSSLIPSPASAQMTPDRSPSLERTWDFVVEKTKAKLRFIQKWFGPSQCRYSEAPSTTDKMDAPWVTSYQDKVDSLIIRENGGADQKPNPPDLAKWDKDIGFSLKLIGGPLFGSYLVQLPIPVSAQTAAGYIEKMLKADGAPSSGTCRYLFVDTNRKVETEAAISDDPAFAGQWPLKENNGVNATRTKPLGANFETSWAAIDKLVSAGDVKLTPQNIAVIDVGFATVPPPGFAQELEFLPGVGFHRNAKDDVSCLNLNKLCHGTAVSAVIAAKGNNKFATVGALGIGISPNINSQVFKLIPIDMGLLVTNHDGTKSFVPGTEWDMTLGIAYALGEEVDTAVGKAKPTAIASVINISVGFDRQCDGHLQAAVSKATKLGVVVITGAGNIKGQSKLEAYSPASCKGAIAVTAHDSSGSGDTRYFPGVKGQTISAPGLRVPTWFGYEMQPMIKDGTSYATPLVTAAAALLKSISPNLSRDGIYEKLRDTGTPKAISQPNRDYPALDVIKAIKSMFPSHTDL